MLSFKADKSFLSFIKADQSSLFALAFTLYDMNENKEMGRQGG